MDKTVNYWSRSVDALLQSLNSNYQGLDSATAQQRIQQYGHNTLAADHGATKAMQLFLERFRSPLVLILIFAAVVAMLMHDWLDAMIVLGIVFITVVLSFIQEYRATQAVEQLRKQVAIKTTVLRDGQTLTIPVEEVVPGDIVLLTAGSLIPGDGVLIEAKDFHVSQALLTGETYPVEKHPGISSDDAGLVTATGHLHQRSGCLASVLAIGWHALLVSFSDPIGDRQIVLRPGCAQWWHGRHSFLYRSPESPRNSQPCVHGHTFIKSCDLLWRLFPCRVGNSPAAVFLSCNRYLDHTGSHCFFVGRSRHPGRRIVAAWPGAKKTSAGTFTDAKPEQADANHRECTARIIAQPGIDSGCYLAACICICTGRGNLMGHVAGCKYATVVLGGASVFCAGLHGGDDWPDSLGAGQF